VIALFKLSPLRSFSSPARAVSQGFSVFLQNVENHVLRRQLYSLDWISDGLTAFPPFLYSLKVSFSALMTTISPSRIAFFVSCLSSRSSGKLSISSLLFRLLKADLIVHIGYCAEIHPILSRKSSLYQKKGWRLPLLASVCSCSSFLLQLLESLTQCRH